MSVNVTVDGNIYSGVENITVGGKNLVLEAVASAVSGGNVASGSFTPTENTFEHKVETGLDKVNVFLCVIDNGFTSQGVRTLNLVLYDGKDVLSVGSNASGSAHFVGGDYNASNGPKISIEGGTVTITTGNSASNGYLITQAYNWYAW